MQEAKRSIKRVPKDILSYRGGVGHWSYVFHRLTGIGVLLFLIVHIVDTALIGWGPDIYNKAIALYRHPLFRLSEVGLFAAVLYHALNGLRIVILDFWPRFIPYHKKLFWIEMVILIVTMIPVSILMIMPIFGGAHG